MTVWRVFRVKKNIIPIVIASLCTAVVIETVIIYNDKLAKHQTDSLRRVYNEVYQTVAEVTTSTSTSTTSTTPATTTTVTTTTGAPEYEVKEVDLGRKNKVVSILRWKHMGEIILDKVVMVSPQKFKQMGCKVSDCQLLKGRKALNESDIIWLDLDQLRDMTDAPKTRKPYHKWMFMAREPPSIMRPHKAWGSNYNLTMTYRLDSDVPDVYGGIEKKKDPQKYTSHGYPQKEGIWIVSNCFPQSNRELYVRELRKYMSITVFGKCGHDMPQDCNMKKDHFKDCTNKFRAGFRWNLSFENSLCKDYVTEKFWEVLMIHSVPLVLGLADYKAFAPPKSYVDVKNFTSAQEVAKFVRGIDKKEYLTYFKWKDTYVPVRYLPDHAKVLCKLCSVAHELQNTVKIYPDVGHWWLGDTCISLDQHLHQDLSPFPKIM